MRRVICLGAASFWILSRTRKIDSHSSNSETQIYKNQLIELTNERELGMITQADFANARIEIGRRMLNHSKGEKSDLISDTNPKLVYLLIVGFGAIASIGYFLVGSIGHRDMPFSSRTAELLSRPPQTLSQNEVLVLLQQRAKSDPQDPIAHLLIAKLLAGEGRDDEALRAIQACLRRDQGSAEALAELGGILFRLNGNLTNSEVENSLNAALQLEPHNLTAIFYRGQILWKTGNKDQAFSVWQAAWAALPNADLRREGLIIRVLNEVSTLETGPLASSLGADPSSIGPMEDQVKSMVQRRIDRLDQNPDDIGLRLSLVKVQMAMGQAQEASELLEAGKNYIRNSPFKSAMLRMAQQSISTNTTQRNNPNETPR